MRASSSFRRALVAWVCLLSSGTVFAEAARDRFSAGGYFRLSARPDFQGGYSRLGFWNLYGRLLNENSYGNLELRLDVLQAQQQGDPWASVMTRLEANSVPNADAGNGGFIQGRVQQMAARAGNILFERVTWSLGTLDTYFPDLHLYDLRPGQLLDQMLGLSAFYAGDRVDFMVGVGDSGWNIRRADYNTIFTVGGSTMIRIVPSHFEVGLGAQAMFEPSVEGNRFAPYRTPGLTYENYVRGEVVSEYLQANPGREDLFPDPNPVSSQSWRVNGYVGFGNFGPLKWMKFVGRYEKLHPLNYYTETVAGRDYNIYIQELTDQRYRFEMGTEAVIELWPQKIDAMWATLYGGDRNRDNTVAAGEDNRNYYSTVLRLQTYLTSTFHLITEGSYAIEKSLNGNLFRNHYDSVFASTGGASDARGLQFGDADIRRTTQLKAGVVFNPLGRGVYSRPSIRVLYGLQHSTQQAAFGNGFSEDLSQYNDFPGRERHWHSVLSLEAEAWF